MILPLRLFTRHCRGLCNLSARFVSQDEGNRALDYPTLYTLGLPFSISSAFSVTACSFFQFRHIHRSIQLRKNSLRNGEKIPHGCLIYSSGYRHRETMGGSSSSIEACISHGPWGGSNGKDWVYMPESFIKKITLVHAGVIDRIRFQSDGETQTAIFGGTGGNKTDTICIDYPNEYLTAISGTIGEFGGCIVVMSLCFHTNKIRYGPYGCDDKGTRFSYDGKSGVIAGFHGRDGKYINAIGIYVIPKSLVSYRNLTHEENSIHELCCRMSSMGMSRDAGPWGMAVGKPWDDGVFSHVKQVRVYLGESLKVISAIQFEYVKRDDKSVFSQMHGGTGGGKTEVINVDGTKEYLTGISGFCGPVEGYVGLEGITSITFHTNKGKHGPYGHESGAHYVYFTSTASPGKIVGFHGMHGDFVTAIGVHMEYF
ncbi:hypothetical protein L1887_20535 [Cichorium endivia]|nr:hypothetical protein L1887_20535 [Cichorium endivia]